MQLTPYLHFTGRTEEALNFYAAAGLGEVTNLSRFGDKAAQHGRATPDQIMHARITADGHDLLMASDGGNGDAIQGMSLSIGLTDSARAHALFAALSEGGKVVMPMAKQFWGAEFGMFNDRFGVQWMINCDTPAA